jgi:hypothetical protein
MGGFRCFGPRLRREPSGGVMSIFKRSGEQLTLPGPAAEHQQTLNERKTAAGAKVAELEQRIEALTAEARESLLEGRFDDNAEATVQLEWSREEFSSRGNRP